MQFQDDDEYETPEQAQARLANTIRSGLLTGLNAIAERESGETRITEYGVFNQAEFWEPLYASGELAADMRQMLDDPMHTTGNMRSAVKYADLRNEERAQQGKMDKYGPVVVRAQTIVKSRWVELTYDELDAARRR